MRRWITIGVLCGVLSVGARAEAQPTVRQLLPLLPQNGPPVGTPVCSRVETSRTWRASDGPYVITCDATIVPGATVEVEAGTEVRFRPGTGLRVEGKLVALGNAARPVRLTADVLPPGTPGRPGR